MAKIKGNLFTKTSQRLLHIQQIKKNVLRFEVLINGLACIVTLEGCNLKLIRENKNLILTHKEEIGININQWIKIRFLRSFILII